MNTLGKQDSKLCHEHGPTNNFLSLVWNITKLPHRIELDIPKKVCFLFFDFVTSWRENDVPTLTPIRAKNMLGTFLKRLCYKDLKTVKTLKIRQNSAKIKCLKFCKIRHLVTKNRIFSNFESPYLRTALLHVFSIVTVLRFLYDNLFKKVTIMLLARV
jgi:hypothetical protein